MPASSASSSASSAHPPLRIQVASFNFNLQGQSVPFPNLQEWLIPTLSEKRSEYNAASRTEGREAPDIYAVGFQELLPLHLAFAESEEAKDIRLHTGREIRRSIRPHAAVTRPDGMYPPGSGPEDYTIIAEEHLVGISLYILGRNQSRIAARVKEIRLSTASTGILNILGNKGGVAARIVLATRLASSSSKLEVTETEEVLTFVSAHLTPHDHLVERRNRDFKTIVQRLAFPPDSAVSLPAIINRSGSGLLGSTSRAPDAQQVREQYEATRENQTEKQRLAKTGVSAAIDKETYGLYDAHHVFFFGDLNYRIHGGKGNGSDSSDDVLSPKEIRRKVVQDSFRELTKYDQLALQMNDNKTFHGFTEMPLAEAGFGPTYKYKPIRGEQTKSRKSEDGGDKGEKPAPAKAAVSELSGKRIPGWTDRILWSSSSSSSSTKTSSSTSLDSYTSQGTSVTLFRSIQSYTFSDHKPITLLATLTPLSSPDQGFISKVKADSLPSWALKRDPQWKTYLYVGRTCDYLVGLAWTTLISLGLGNVVLGAAQIAVVVLLTAAFFGGGLGGVGGDVGYWIRGLLGSG